MKSLLMPRASIAALLATSAPAAVLGPVRAEADPIINMLKEVKQETNRLGNDLSDRLERVETRQADLEQSASTRRGGGGGGNPASLMWGAQVENSAAAKTLSSDMRGTVRFPVTNAITSAGNSAGALVAPDRRTDPIQLPYRSPAVRQLFAQGRTTSRLIEWPVQKTRVNNAAAVAETTQKPQSDSTWDLVQFPVRTLAHWIPVSRQMMDDVPVMASLIDTDLRYGLEEVEAAELLKGDGTGEHLSGVITTAQMFANPIPDFELTQRIDVLLAAIAQVDLTKLPADGIVLNPLDWAAIRGLKDTTGRYLSEPFQDLAARLFSMPVATSYAMDQDEFLVGSFQRGAEVFDRMETEVLVSSEDRDNFIKNMLTVRGEERLAFVKKYPNAFVYGSFSEALTAG